MRWCALIALVALAGCSSRHVWSGQIEPEGLVIRRETSFHVRVEGLKEHALYVAQLERDLARQLVLAGWQHESRPTELELVVAIDWLEPGNERGTLAECHVTVYVTRGGSEWRFEAHGDSAGRWNEDRVPTAVENVARAAAERLLTAQED